MTKPATASLFTSFPLRCEEVQYISSSLDLDCRNCARFLRCGERSLDIRHVAHSLNGLDHRIGGFRFEHRPIDIVIFPWRMLDGPGVLCTHRLRAIQRYDK